MTPTKNRQMKVRSDILAYYDKKARDLDCTKLEDLFEKLYDKGYIQQILGDYYGKPPILTTN
jgi:hypothetical protein